MNEWILATIGALFGVLLGVIGWLLIRSIGHMDNTMKGLSDDHKQLAADLQEVKTDLVAAKQLREFQDRRIEALENEKRVLYNAIHEMDRLIYRKLGESVKLREG